MYLHIGKFTLFFYLCLICTVIHLCTRLYLNVNQTWWLPLYKWTLVEFQFRWLHGTLLDRILMTHFYFLGLFFNLLNWNSSQLIPNQKLNQKNSPENLGPKIKTPLSLVFCLNKFLVPGLELSVLFVISLMEWNRNNKGRMGDQLYLIFRRDRLN